MNEIISAGLTFVDGDIKTGTRKHTYNDFGLIMKKHIIPRPKPKTQTVSIPGNSGVIDITEASGEVTYNQRSGLNFEFAFRDRGRSQIEKQIANLSNFIHGKKMLMISDLDQDFFYVVRLEIDFAKLSTNWSNVTISGTAEPFKYALYADGSDWLWDTFNFETGIIVKYKDIVVASSKTINLAANTIFTVPTFKVKELTSSIRIVVGTNSVTISEVGDYYFPQLRINYTNSTIRLSGNGKLDIEFRGKYL